MKLKKFKKGLFLLGLLSAMLVMTSCKDQEVAQLTGKSPVPQLSMDVPPSDNISDVIWCGCNNPAPTITTSKEIQTLVTPKNQNKRFQVKVNSLSGCSEYTPTNGDCTCKGKRYYLAFNQNYQLSDFQNITVTMHDGVSGLEFFAMPNGDGIYAKQPFIATFEWTSANNTNQTPTAAQLSDGGICIIGVVTDPHVPGDIDPIREGNNG